MMMRLRTWILLGVVACGLTGSGCGKVDNTPPPNTTTDTPLLDIEEGTEASAGEIDKKLETTPGASDTDSQSAAGATSGGH